MKHPSTPLRAREAIARSRAAVGGALRRLAERIEAPGKPRDSGGSSASLRPQPPAMAVRRRR